MRQDFETADLKAELERSLGFRLRTLRRLDGASALNFKAVREADGLAFAVKCSPACRQVMFEHLVRHLDETAGTKAVSRLFKKECPSTFRGHNVICLSWCAGERRFPDQLTRAELEDFLGEYLRFSAAMQNATLIMPPDPIEKWRAGAFAACRGALGRPLRNLIERELPAEEVRYRSERLGIIHGDFHHGNFLFVAGKLNGIFDLEEFCGGYPADDVVRYFVCAAEHLRWYEQGRKAQLMRRFAEAVAFLRFPVEDWLTAIDGLLVRKLYMKTRGRRVGVAQVVNLLFRARFYLALKRIVRSSLA